jgi:hypothetical protein
LICLCTTAVCGECHGLRHSPQIGKNHLRTIDATFQEVSDGIRPGKALTAVGRMIADEPFVDMR